MSDRGQYLDVILAVVISFVMSNLGVGALVFTLPLLVLAKRTSRLKTDTACVAVLVLVLLKLVFTMRSVVPDALTLGLVGVNLFVPLSLILGALVWVNTTSEPLFRRILLMCVPPFVVFFLLEIWFSLDQEVALGVMEDYRNLYRELIGSLAGDSAERSDLVFQVFMYGILGCVVAFTCLLNIANAFVASVSGRIYDPAKDERIMYFRVPAWFIYPFLLLWAVVLAIGFVDVPVQLVISVLNLAVMSLMIYGMQGFAIVYFNLRRRMENLRSIRLFFVFAFLLFFFVGANLILWFGLPLVGVLENWVELRKRKQGVYKNEDHSL